MKNQEGYKLGSKFILKGTGEKFILAQIGYRVFNLISLKSGNRYSDGLSKFFTVSSKTGKIKIFLPSQILRDFEPYKRSKKNELLVK
jgi:hypothetical protein